MSTLRLSVARARAHMGLVPFVALPVILLLTALLYLPSLPAGSTLYVVDAPPARLFAGGPFFMTPAVQWYHPGVETKVVGPHAVAEVQSSMGDQNRILFFERD